MLLDAVGSAASLDAPAHGADASFTYAWWFSKNACGGAVNTNGFGWEYMVSHCEEDCANPYDGAPHPPPPRRHASSFQALNPRSELTTQIIQERHARRGMLD